MGVASDILFVEIDSEEGGFAHESPGMVGPGQYRPHDR
jgi:hypothetical protein